MNDKSLKTANLSDFKFAPIPLLCGEALNDIKLLARSIQKVGIICPIVVTRVKDKLVVIDGRKRLMALQRLSFDFDEQVSDFKIPYVTVLEFRQGYYNTPDILSSEKVYDHIQKLKSKGFSEQTIAATLGLCRHTVFKISRLSRLSSEVRSAYFQGLLSFDQTIAYGTCPDKQIQTYVFLQIGPLVKANHIVAVLRASVGRLAGSKQFSTGQDSNVVPLHKDPLFHLSKIVFDEDKDSGGDKAA
jgi:hypothetical protein